MSHRIPRLSARGLTYLGAAVTLCAAAVGLAVSGPFAASVAFWIATLVVDGLWLKENWRKKTPIERFAPRLAIVTTVALAIWLVPRQWHSEHNKRRPATREDMFSTWIPFNTGSGAPIPYYVGGFFDSKVLVEDPIGKRYKWLGMLATNVVTQDGDIGNVALIDANKPKAPGTRRALLAEVLQYYIIQQIDVLQTDTNTLTTTLGFGAEASSKLGVHPPDPMRYDAGVFLQAIAANRLSTLDKLDVRWPFGGRGYWAPKHTQFRISNKKVNGGVRYVFTMENASLYRLDFTVESGISFGPVLGFLKDYRTLPPFDPRSMESHIFVIRTLFAFQRRIDTDPLEEEEYSKWASALLAGLRNDFSR